jgi:hypothetical protein
MDALNFSPYVAHRILIKVERTFVNTKRWRKFIYIAMGSMGSILDWRLRFYLWVNPLNSDQDPIF